MFSNRAYGLKVAIAAALIVGACVWSDRNGDDINPQYWRCVLKPEKFRDATLWIPTALVLRTDDEGFWIKNGQKYFRLATTGGQSALGGLEAGQFDHVLWVTMTADGPVFANLLLEGVLDEDARNNMPVPGK